jgi:NADH-quinone oxidoreductase subunit A
MSYYYAAVFGVVAFVFGLILLGVSRLIHPDKVSKSKLEPYECGMEPLPGDWRQYKARYYIFALLFVIFDVEIAFLYPWATIFREFGLVSLIEMFVFIGVLLLGLVYVWKKGFLKWL